MSDRIRRMFATIEEHLDPDVFAAYLTDDARLQFGNAPVIQGRTAIRNTIAHFYAGLSTMRHEIVGLWDHGDTAVVEAVVHYTRRNGASVSLPCTTVWRLDGDRIADDRIYMDATPLTASPPDTEHQIALALRFYEPYRTGNLDLLDVVLASDWADHPPAPGQEPGPGPFKPRVAGLRHAFPDLAVQTEDVIAAGDRVVVRSVLTGTHQGQLLDIPPTGKPVAMRVIDIHRIADGRIAETWHIEDVLGMLEQLGLAPGAAATSAPTP